MTQEILVGVIGASDADSDMYEIAREVGGEIARRGWWLLCGGLGGVMEAACRGAREAGGHTIGILPGADRNAANPWVEIAVVTGMAEARNIIIARTAHVCIAIGGGYGTLSEIAFCMKFGTPIIALACPWAGVLQDGKIVSATTAQAACDHVATLL